MKELTKRLFKTVIFCRHCSNYILYAAVFVKVIFNCEFKNLYLFNVRRYYQKFM